jgi:hypothetical protein
MIRRIICTIPHARWRIAFMLSFIVPEVPRIVGTMIPNYEGFGDRVCALLSLLFGNQNSRSN